LQPNFEHIWTILYSIQYTCSSNSLKGHCHEMNNFFEGLKNQISTFMFLLASMKTLTNSVDFTGSCKL
jgi:hypothetical protein